MEWLLLIIIASAGPNGVAMTSLSGFVQQKGCESAATEVKAALDRRNITSVTLCVRKF